MTESNFEIGDRIRDISEEHIFLTPATEMSRGDYHFRRHEVAHKLYSLNEKRQFKIYTPGEIAPIMTGIGHHTASVTDLKSR